MKRKTLFRWLKIIIITYCAIGIALYYLQEKFLFHPEKLSRDHVFNFTQDPANKVSFEEIDIPFDKTDTVNMIKFFPKDPARRGVVIYFHGNRQNVERYAKFANNFTRHGYEVWMPDYPGFGKSTGERTEKKLYEQALQIQRMAARIYAKDSIIVYGKSFGTGIAAYVASESKNQRLVLETPYYSIPSLFACYAPIYPANSMSTYKIPTYQFLQDVTYPVSIFHGTDDGVIPYGCAAKLKKILKPADEFITIEDGSHHNLNDLPLFRQKLDSLLLLR